MKASIDKNRSILFVPLAIAVAKETPVSGKWNPAKDCSDYYYSSAGFYETCEDEFGFLKNLFHE
jgi:hypothetical protein